MITVVLPIFNEANGISGFLNELNENLIDFSPHFIAVDDQSTDNTNSILRDLKSNGFPISIIQNEVNRGHGFSVITGIKKATELSPNLIVICDGDGQFNGADVKMLVELQFRNPNSIVEGARFGRNDPWFREFISLATRVLVSIACGKTPKDANTPLRVLPLEKAIFLISKIEENCLIPNLAISAFSRVEKFEILQIDVRSLPPRRNIDSIDQWKQKTNFLPSKRLLRFAFFATISWKNIAIKCFKIREFRSKI